MILLKHLLGSFFRAFFRIVFTAIVCAVIAGGASLFLAYAMGGSHWPPTLLTEIAAIALAVLGAYAGGITVLVQEAVRGVKAAERDVVRAVEH